MTLRPLRVDDAAEMSVVLADRALYEFTGGEPPTRDELHRRYAVQTRGRSSDGSETWVNSVIVTADGSAVGYVQATIPGDGRPTEIAWVVGRPWQRRGYASKATALLVGGLRERGVTRIIAHIHPDHGASQRIARSLGLKPTDVVEDGEVRWSGVIA